MGTRAFSSGDAPACRSKAPEPAERAAAAETERVPPAREAGDGRAAFALEATPAVSTASLTMTGAAEQVAPHVLSMAHWARLLEGELYATSSRLDWRTLLKRTFDVDLRVCVLCGGKLAVRGLVTDTASVQKLLAALRRPRAPPAAA